MKKLSLTKRYLSLVGLLVVFNLMAQTPTQTENYIFIQEPIFETSSIIDTTSAIRTINYFDGLGRPKETVQVNASPPKNSTESTTNIVVRYEYDGFGRGSIQNLPVPLRNQNNYNITNDSEYSSSVLSQYGAQPIYSEKTFENSPLNRVLSQSAPGTDWQKGSGNEIEFSYHTNHATEVYIYSVTNGWNIVRGGYYAVNSLYKTTTIDENGHEMHEFKNKQGQVVLKRTSVGGGVIAGRGTSPETEVLQTVDTYYIYDDHGNLVGVVPPLAALKSSISSDVLDRLCYIYKYDEKNRLTDKKLPGKGWEFMVYDKQDRLVATQDEVQRNDGGKWLFTKYDKFGRVVYTGITTGSRTEIENQVNSVANFNNETRTGSFSQNGLTIHYTKSAFPISFTDVLTVNYYDGFYNGEQWPTYKYETVDNKITTETSQLKGLATLNSIRVLGTNTWEHNYTYYDKNLRPIKTIKKNHLGGKTEVDSKLNFKGFPLLTYTLHKRSSNGIEVKIEDFFEYDNMLRLTSHRQSLNDSPTKHTIAVNEYNKKGELITKKVGGKAQNASDRWQEINYTYNIRGWLTSINQVNELMGGNLVNPPAPNDDLFSFEIKYNNPVSGLGAKALYNGNISQTFWRTGSDNFNRGYTYTYDQLNRLRNADFSVANTPINAYGEYLAYDVNGNITTLKRSMGDVMDNEIDMDNLTYTYEGNNGTSNRLLKVVDSVTTNNSHGFDNGGSGTSNDYTYDVNGNMISDLNKGISEIKYNHLNLPTEISWTNSSNKIRYVYPDNYRDSGSKTKEDSSGWYNNKNRRLFRWLSICRRSIAVFSSSRRLCEGYTR